MEPAGAERNRRARPRGFRSGDASQSIFFAELKRRNVYNVEIAYATVEWLLIQIGNIG
jgi:hypothetical protein